MHEDRFSKAKSRVVSTELLLQMRFGLKRLSVMSNPVASQINVTEGGVSKGSLTHKGWYSELLLMEKIFLSFLSMDFLSRKGFRDSSCLVRDCLPDSRIKGDSMIL